MTIDEARALAEEAALRHVSDAEPGIRRVRRGRGFSYVTPAGETLQGEARAAVEALAIPPAWEDVWICADPVGHVRATGRDAQGRKQYLYHPAWERVRDRVKFARLGDFGAALPALRRQVDADLRRRGMPREKVVALAVALLDTTLLRVGNDEYAARNGSYGLTTLEAGHVDLGTTYIEFEFTGKGGAERRLRVSDRRLARLVAQCHELPGQRLFTYQEDGGARAIGSGDVNAYLLEHMGECFSAKDFRTWGGSAAAAGFLAPQPAAGLNGQAPALVLAAYDHAADLLGNTRDVARDSYVHPRIPEAFASGELHALWKGTRGGHRLARRERLLTKLL